MLITLFQISKNFLDTIYTFIREEDLVENNVLDNVDEENRLNENSDDNYYTDDKDDKDEDDDTDDDDDLLGFEFLKQVILSMYFSVSKKVNPNKSE
jgi:predicted RNA-binding protein with RPS1 domain